MHRGHWNFYSGSQITFGPRGTSALRHIVERRSAKRVFLVTDKTLENAGVVAPAEAFIQHAGAELLVYNEAEVQPTTNAAALAAQAARDFRPDLFVAIGGGSNMDLAKAGRILFAHDVEIQSLFGFDGVPGPLPPLVCLPTTAGTGSEVSHTCVLQHSETGKSETIRSQRMRPEVAIVDPYLSVTCPKHVTAQSGFAALTHAIEAFLATSFFAIEEQDPGGLPHEGNNPIGDLYAGKAIELIGKHLPQAFEEPEDLAARSGMALAATLAGIASANCGVGLTHALEYSIGSKYHSSHGLGKAIALPATMEHLSAYREARIARVGELLGAANDGKSAANKAVSAVQELRAAVELPTRLRDLGAQEDELHELADRAFSLQGIIELAPGPPTVDDGLAILKASF